jgi:hypothetical protein
MFLESKRSLLLSDICPVCPNEQAIDYCMAAMFVVASGARRSFYLAGAQEQDTTDTSATENAEVTLGSTQVQSGSTLDVNGNNFGAYSDVSIYMMFAVQAELEDGTAIIL